MFSVAEEEPPRPSVRRPADHRRRRRTCQIPGDQIPDDDVDAYPVGWGRPDATEQRLRRALVRDRRMSRLRKGQARLH
jgi:hypothetical protein